MIQIKAIFVEPNFRMVQIIDSDQNTAILFESDIRLPIRKKVFTESSENCFRQNRPYMNRLRVSAVQEWYYPLDPFIQDLKKMTDPNHPNRHRIPRRICSRGPISIGGLDLKRDVISRFNGRNEEGKE